MNKIYYRIVHTIKEMIRSLLILDAEWKELVLIVEVITTGQTDDDHAPPMDCELTVGDLLLLLLGGDPLFELIDDRVQVAVIVGDASSDQNEQQRRDQQGSHD